MWAFAAAAWSPALRAAASAGLWHGPRYVRRARPPPPARGSGASLDELQAVKMEEPVIRPGLVRCSNERLCSFMLLIFLQHPEHGPRSCSAQIVDPCCWRRRRVTTKTRLERCCF